MNLVAANLGHKAKTGLRTLRNLLKKINMRNVDIVFCLQTTVLETTKSKDITKCLPGFLAMIFDNARLGTRFPLFPSVLIPV